MKGGMMLNIFWGILMIAIGLFMVICGYRKSDFLLYRILVARSEKLWGRHVHTFYLIAGVLVCIAGVVMLVVK